MSSVVVLQDERGLIAELEAAAALTVVRHAQDPAEALAVIGSGLARVAILACPAVVIDNAFVEALHRVGGRGIALVSGEADRLRLERLGLTVVAYDAPAAQVQAAVLTLAGTHPDPAVRGAAAAPDPPGPSGGEGPRTAQPPGATPIATETGTTSRGGFRRRSKSPPPPLRTDAAAPARGRITTVWGTGGAPGRSLVALNLAVESALSGRSTVLVDADTHASSLGQALGLLDESARLVRLCRGVERGSFDPAQDSEAYARVRAAGAMLRFTSGLPRPERWAEVSAPSLGRALQALALLCDEVIIDVAAPVGRDDELALDSFAPQRNDATVAAIGASDRVLAIGRGDPVGLPRLMRLCEEAATLPAGPRPSLVINQVRASVSGVRPEAAIASAWERFGPRGLAPSHFLPHDAAAADAALRRGTPLAEAAPRSALRRAIAALVA